MNKLLDKVHTQFEAYFKSMYDVDDPTMMFHGKEAWDKQVKKALQHFDTELAQLVHDAGG